MDQFRTGSGPPSGLTVLAGAYWLTVSRSTSWHWFPPMAPAVAKPFHRDGGVKEKVDGWRIVAIKEGRHVYPMSRTGKDHATRFPDIARAVAELPTRTTIIDGEVAVFDADLIGRFHF